MNILITNVYSWKNKGDAAIIICMIDHIKKEFPNAKIAISSLDKEDKNKYNEDCFFESFLTLVKENYLINNTNSLKERLLNNLNYINLLIKLRIYSYFLRKGINLKFLFKKEIFQKIQEYKNFDLIIAAGGGYFISKNKKNKLEKLFNYDENILFAYDFFLGDFYKKPIILYNQSIGPFFSEKDKKNLLPFLKKAKAIICREKLTYKRLSTLGLKNLILSEDIAFNLKMKFTSYLAKYNLSNNDIKIGFTVRKCLIGKEQAKYENEIAKFIEYLIKNDKKIKIFFMPQVIANNFSDNDLVISKRIKEKIKDKYQSNVFIIEEDFHPSELKYIYSQMDYFFGTRMHSCIFALDALVKTIALSYEPKTDGIMENLNLQHYILHVNKVNTKKLIELFEKLKKDENYIPRLKKSLIKIKNKSYVNLRKIYEEKK